MDITELKRSKNKFNRHPWELARARIIYFLLNKTKEKFGHIVDVGSGDAYILNHLAKEHKEALLSAIDTAYSQELIKTLENTEDRINFFASLQEFKERHTGGDITLFLDILEHCKDDKEVLKTSVNSILTKKNTSYIIITVPAFQALFSQHDQLLAHYRRYSRKTLLKLCKDAGVSPVQSGYFFFSLLPVRLIQLALEKLSLYKPGRTIDNWEGNGPLTRLISQILWIDFRICFTLSNLGIRLPGLSCYCICKTSP